MKSEHIDPAVDDIRAIRHAISAEHEHDPRKLVLYYMELQKRHADRLYRVSSDRTEPDTNDIRELVGPR